MKKVSINGQEFYFEPNEVKITPNLISEAQRRLEEIKEPPESPYDLDKYTYNCWCNLIAWLMNCDELHFMNPPRIRTAKDIFESSSTGELMFVSSAARWISKVIKADFPQEWREKIDKCLNGEEIEPEAKFATGFGLKCRTILWKTDAEFEQKVDEILKQS